MVHLAFMIWALETSAPVRALEAPPREQTVESICFDTQAACEDECNFTFGTSHTLRRELGICLSRCFDRAKLCRLRQKAKAERQNGRTP